ncbi:MAG: hypothetical protein A2Y69_06965 [Candidatus Aminicenantes bacterium RBG_13_59_9]|nr:MAG: hypothetical protein A2Y69_06965 [Candidatus Aminicenantes bacterium RBG_13_59_9]
MPTKARIQRVRQVLSSRQPDLRVIFEELTNPHNASAVLRTCDAAGVLHIHYVSAAGQPFPVNKAISTRADKWVVLHHHATMGECVSVLKKKGFQVAATCLTEDARPYDVLDYCRPTAVIFGNESEGITPEAVGLADFKVKIPMQGMVQSLNLSVSVGIVLYEALRQRRATGYGQRRRLSNKEYAELTKKWLSPGKE